MLSLLAATIAQKKKSETSPIALITQNQARDSRAGLETESSSGQQDKRPLEEGEDKQDESADAAIRSSCIRPNWIYLLLQSALIREIQAIPSVEDCDCSVTGSAFVMTL